LKKSAKKHRNYTITAAIENPRVIRRSTISLFSSYLTGRNVDALNHIHWKTCRRLFDYHLRISKRSCWGRGKMSGSDFITLHNPSKYESGCPNSSFDKRIASSKTNRVLKLVDHRVRVQADILAQQLLIIVHRFSATCSSTITGFISSMLLSITICFTGILHQWREIAQREDQVEADGGNERGNRWRLEERNDHSL
jgi:hypothetical protein